MKGNTIKMKRNTVKLSAVLTSFVALWAISAVLHTTFLWIAGINLIALCLICRYKIVDRKDILTGAIFGVLCIPSDLWKGLYIVLPYIASMTIFRNSSNKIFLYENKKKNNFAVTLILIFAVGGILGGINVFFAMGSMPVHLSFRLQWIFDAMRAGIFEEIFFRLFFFALCVYVTHDQPLTGFQNVLAYSIIVIPHVLIHFNLQTFQLGSLIMLTLLFGIPFAVMQRKSNLIAAIGSHAFVDFIRFCVLGA